MPESTPIELDAAGRTVAVSNPDKVFFSERGETKLDLIRYYLAVEAEVMRALGGRPVLMERYPNGAGGTSFFQKRVPANAPEWLETTTVQTPNGTPSRALVVADVAHLAWAVNLGCLGFHVWPYHADDPEHADELRIDLDPSPGVTFDMVREAAAETKRLLDDLGLVGGPKTTGRNGIHIYVRLEPRFDAFAVRSAAVALARELERRRPDLITAAWWKEERGTRVFCDFNQNAPHKTVLGAWSVRPRVGGQVSTPFRWDELEAIAPEELTLANVPARVASSGDPWEAMSAAPQPLEALLEWHERDTAAGLQDAPWPPASDPLPVRSERVTLRRLRAADLTALQAYRNHPEVGRYQGWEPMSDAAAAAMIAGMAAAPCPTPGDWVQIAIADAFDDGLLGDIGLHVSAAGDEAELGITLARYAQGQGLAAEAAGALIGMLREHTQVRRLIGITDVRNTASARLLERLGMTLEGEEETIFQGEPCREARDALVL